MSLNHRAVKYVGSGLSTFQSNPLYGGKENFTPTSDWEYLLAMNLKGVEDDSHIRGLQQPCLLPQFLSHREEYFARALDHGENMFRFSVEWGRACPYPFKADERYLENIAETLAMIRMHGMEPMLTLNHVTLPLYLVERDSKGRIVPGGGWEHREILMHFEFFMDRIAHLLVNKDRMSGILAPFNLDAQEREEFLEEGLVKYVMTINEPLTVLRNGYVCGSFPPFAKLRYAHCPRMLETMVSAHDIARRVLKEMGEKMNVPPHRTPQVGVGHTWNLRDGPFADYLHRTFDRGVADAFEREGMHSDFLGLQYYFRKTTVPFGTRTKDWGDHPGFGDVFPGGISRALHAMHDAYGEKPIFVTGFGFADAKDLRRPWWILHTVHAIVEAMEEGVPVEGVLHWSIADNMEWEQGMGVPFGLYSERKGKLISRPKGSGVRSYEAWSAAVQFLRWPSEEHRKKVHRLCNAAQIQYRSAGGVY